MSATLPPVDLTRDALLDAKQAGELLGVKASTVNAWALEGRLPCLQLSARVRRWTRPMLEQFCADRLNTERG